MRENGGRAAGENGGGLPQARRACFLPCLLVDRLLVVEDERGGLVFFLPCLSPSPPSPPSLSLPFSLSLSVPRSLIINHRSDPTATDGFGCCDEE